MDLKALQASLAIGSDNYEKVSSQVKEFLRFNGYAETLRSIEKEEEKKAASTEGEKLDN